MFHSLFSSYSLLHPSFFVSFTSSNLFSQVAGDCMVLCRDARDGFDKLALDARKLAVEGARKQWESRTSLAVALTQQKSFDVVPAIIANSIVKIEEDKDDSKLLDSTKEKKISENVPVIKTEKNHNIDDNNIQSNPSLKTHGDFSSTQNIPLTPSTSMDVPLSVPTSTTLSLSTSFRSVGSIAGCVPVSSVSVPFSLRFEDMPISASRIVNPFSR